MSYNEAKEKYAALGVDTEAAVRYQTGNLSISLLSTYAHFSMQGTKVTHHK